MRQPFDFDFLDSHIHALAISSSTNLEFQSLPPLFRYKKAFRETSDDLKKEISYSRTHSRLNKELVAIEFLCRYNSGLVVKVTIIRDPEDLTKIESIDLSSRLD